MSQILRVTNIGHNLLDVYSKHVFKLYECSFCNRASNRTFTSNGKFWFSENTRPYSTKPNGQHMGKLPAKHKKSVIEDARKAQFKELLKTFQSVKQQKSQSFKSSGSSTVSQTAELDYQTEENFKINLEHFKRQISDQTTCNQSLESEHMDGSTSNESFLLQSDIASEEFDTKKPVLNESLISSVTPESVPAVKALNTKPTKQPKKQKKNKKTNELSKQNLLKRLLASHPFIEHIQTKADSKLDPNVINNELSKLLENESISEELRKDITQYLSKVTTVPEDEVLSKFTWNPEDLRDPERLKEVTSVVVKMFHPDLNKAAKESAIALEEQRKMAMYNKEAAAYVDACIITGMLNRAHTLIIGPTENKRRRGRRKIHKSVTSIEVYNTLMHAWAKQGKLEQIRELFQHMESLDLTPSLQSYAAVLECLGRQRNPEQDLVDKVIEDISSRDYILDNICIQCKLNQAEWKCIEKVITSVWPNFRPVAKADINTNYDCALLNDLNYDKQNTPNPFSGVLSTEELRSKAKDQLNLELSDKVVVKSIVPPVKVTAYVKHMRKLLEKTKARWQTVLRFSFLREVEKLEKKAKDDFTAANILPYMRLFPADTFVDMMLQQIDLISQEMESFSPPLAYLHSTLGYRVYHRLELLRKQRAKQVDQMTRLYDAYLEQYNAPVADGNLREAWQGIEAGQTDGSHVNVASNKWPHHVAKSVGRFLFNVIMTEVRVDANLFRDTTERSEIPAFYTVPRNRNNIPQDEIKPHPILVKLQRESHIQDLIFQPQDMPSSVPPVPWTSVDSGGNLLCTTELIKNAAPQFTVHRTVPSRDLYPVFDALNTVSSVPWKINLPVLNTIIEVFNSGGDTDLDIPEPISKCPQLPRFLPEMTPEERMQVVFERNRLNKKKKEMFSLWCTELYRLSIANKYRDDIFWFPHNLDFRSRFYAVPPHFNHLGSDVARSMLVFAKGKPLGPEGLDWLKIHLINLTGFKKRSSNKDRLAFADEIMEDILDSADKPLTGRRWWQTSDEPWQTLSCCMEIAKAIRSPDPEEYVCYYPVHQDGSCNGLQHYAALGRDQSGAESVNLCPFESPKDVYSDVVELVEQERSKDANNANKIAAVLEGFVRRKVIKQTIMTTVYGVTRFGARQQIRGQLEDLEDFPQRHVWDAMFYLTDQTFSCLQQMFTSTKEIQDWFVLCAELISRISYQPVEWVTPVGWPVLQPYYRHMVITNPNNTDKTISVEKPNAMKQKNAFPPNFIHSLDSTHMMLTGIYCLRHGVNFVAVHDCFWTHACDVDIMNKHCREQFVALHNQPILEDLVLFLLEKYSLPESEIAKDPKHIAEGKRFVNDVLGNLPSRGSFDIQEVLKSTYFFS